MRDSKKLSLAESIGFWLVVSGSAAEQLDDRWNASRQISTQQMDREFRVQLVLLSWTLNGNWSEFLFTAIIYMGQREYLGKAGIKGGITQEGSFSRIFYLAECENLTSVGVHRTAFRRRICGTAVKRRVDGTPRFPSWMREAGPPGHFFTIRARAFARYFLLVDIPGIHRYGWVLESSDECPGLLGSGSFFAFIKASASLNDPL